MEIKLDVLISTSIKQRKPWPRISWIGQEKEAIFLLDDKRINEINLASGKTKKKIPRLQSLLKNVVVLTTSRNGAWLAGVLTTGELFLWNKDQDCLKIVPAIKESRNIVAAAQECLMRLHLYVSGDGRKALLTTPTACVFLWESTEHENISSYKNSSSGRWTQILPDESVMLPSTEEKEIGVHAAFIQNEILGDCCLCSFVFYSGECLVLTFLILRWHENTFKYVSSLPYQIHWIQQTCCLVNLVPPCVTVKSRGALLCAFARDGLILAVAVNQTDPKATQILFLNTLNFVTVSGSLKGCSSKNSMVPSKFIRSYWVGDMSWTPDSLFLACMLKRGSLMLLTCMGELLTLITSGCSVEFGPAEFIPFHPLISCRQRHSFCQDSSQSLGSSASESDLMRQRFSVASHSRLPYLIVSDGYMITVLRFPNNLSSSGFIRSLLLDSTRRLENVRRNLLNSRSKGRPLCLRSLMSLKAKMSEKTMDLLDYEEPSDDEKQFCDSPSTFYSQRVHSFVVLDESTTQQFSSLKSLLREPPRAVNHDAKTEKRLIVLWRLLYKKVVWYQMQLNRQVNKNAEEESVVSSLLSHVQATLQSSGVTLEQHFRINSVSGEEKFLLGSYRESVDIWKRSLCEIKAKGGKRTCFLQSRYYLAILFCHLYQYNLCEAQGLCDHLVGEILRRSQLSASQMEKFSDTKYFQHELWMVTDVHTETAMAVIRSMARFMAAYFTNQLLYIFPPHSVDILHPLHIKQGIFSKTIEICCALLL
ncbi:ciliogenesis and planar polarity effector 1 [Grus japonensis]|uniref:Ciliogenesis and planar polarity effector 1 n=1 Tax=Grus japonensis TaxID=30415 RepID=A0ABC9Y0G8_GRUJA